MKAFEAENTKVAELLLKQVGSDKVDEATPVKPVLGIACCLRVLDK